jgi:hypothetical protein
VLEVAVVGIVMGLCHNVQHPLLVCQVALHQGWVGLVGQGRREGKEKVKAKSTEIFDKV